MGCSSLIFDRSLNTFAKHSISTPDIVASMILDEQIKIKIGVE